MRVDACSLGGRDVAALTVVALRVRRALPAQASQADQLCSAVPLTVPSAAVLACTVEPAAGRVVGAMTALRSTRCPNGAHQPSKAQPPSQARRHRRRGRTSQLTTPPRSAQTFPNPRNASRHAVLARLEKNSSLFRKGLAHRHGFFGRTRSATTQPPLPLPLLTAAS